MSWSRKPVLIYTFWFSFVSNLLGCSDAQSSFANVTLRSANGDLSAVVFLPEGLRPDEPTYYLSSRFDHSSMIGNIKRVTRNSETGRKKTHLLYGSEQWRVPHDPYWPESGIGLAAEFGVGDDGDFCNYRCGWYQVNEVTNGVLGYQEAKSGESFLKIGVGELIKGSCPTCDSTDVYKFNSPYKFASHPQWQLELNEEENSMTLSHEAILNQYGYQLRKDITLENDQLLVKTTLVNAGRTPFATAWYSHHFFTCDNRPVGPDIGVDVDLSATEGDYEEPGTWFWSTPIEQYANISPRQDAVAVEMMRGVDRDVRIKTEFTKDETTHGSFTLHGCETSIKETIPEIGTEGGVSMYAYNLYIETGTFSPEPQVYMHLWPGQSISWTQQLDFSDKDEVVKPKTMIEYLRADIAAKGEDIILKQISHPLMIFLASIICVSAFLQIIWKRRRRNAGYTEVPESRTVHDENSEQ